jgi:hypothetical protein
MKTLFLLFTIQFQGLLFAQGTAVPFTEAAQKGIDVTKLDSAYQSALHTDTLKAVFNGQETEFQQAYANLLKQLNNHLKTHGFVWKKTVRCFNRIYFSPEGKIDYFLFHFQADDLETGERETFTKLVNAFVRYYTFPLKGKKAFAQCSPVVYKN